MEMSRYWIAVASRDHVRNGVTGGFCQPCRGKPGPLRRMREGDWIIYYSSKERFGSPEPCQAFTAIGRVTGAEVFAYPMSESFVPFRREIQFAPAADAPIQPLIEQLSFITDKRHWGAPFRFGFLEIPQADFEIIAAAMGVSPEPMP